MRSMGYLSRVFHASEEANRGAILRALPRGSRGKLLDLGTHRGDFTARIAGRVAAEHVAGVELIERHALSTRGVRSRRRASTSFTPIR